MCMPADQKTDLRTLQAAIANSPIMAAPVVSASTVLAARAPRDFADWCNRQGGNIDSVILDWLRSQAPRPRALS
jgi:hypothetical protein